MAAISKGGLQNLGEIVATRDGPEWDDPQWAIIHRLLKCVRVHQAVICNRYG